MPEPRPDSAAVKLPPPITFAAPLIVGLLIGKWCPLRLPGALWWIPGWILVAAGLGVAIWARQIFSRRGTSVLPFRPTLVIVVEGPFRVSRNPIYLGFALAYIGGSLLFRSVWPLLFLPIVLLVVHKTAIVREETYLERRFGAQYLEYKNKVRRWL